MNAVLPVPAGAEKARALPSVEELWMRPDLTLTEAARVTGRCYRTLKRMCDDGEVRWFLEAKCVRIVTQSLRERAERLAADQSGGGRG